MVALDRQDFAQMSFAQMSFAQMSLAQMSFAQMSFVQMSLRANITKPIASLSNLVYCLLAPRMPARDLWQKPARVNILFRGYTQG